MAASRAARKREMIANLENEEYLNALANESYAIIFTQSTTASPPVIYKPGLLR